MIRRSRGEQRCAPKPNAFGAAGDSEKSSGAAAQNGRETAGFLARVAFQ
jgi:hypothetical protein